MASSLMKGQKASTKRVLSPSQMLPCLCGCLCTMHRGIPLAIITLFAFFENDGPAMLLSKLDEVLNFIDFLEVGHFQALFFQPLFLVPFILNHCHGGSTGSTCGPLLPVSEASKPTNSFSRVMRSHPSAHGRRTCGSFQSPTWCFSTTLAAGHRLSFDGANDAAQTCRSHGLHSGQLATTDNANDRTMLVFELNSGFLHGLVLRLRLRSPKGQANARWTIMRGLFISIRCP